MQVNALRRPPDGRNTPGQPLHRKPGYRREWGAIHPGNGPQHGILHLTGDRTVELPRPCPLTVLIGPDKHSIAQVMQLNPALAGT